MSIRLEDIASSLHLSKATVSMAINNRPGVNPKTRMRVLSAIQQMGYVPRAPARENAPGKSAICLIVVKKHGHIIGDTPFFNSLTEAIETQARNYGYGTVLLFLSLNNPREIEIQLQRIAEECDGALLFSTEMTCEDMAPFLKLNLPLVAVDSALIGVNVNKVLINNFEGAYNATCYLHRMGNQKIGYLRSSIRIENFHERSGGYRRALHACGLEYSPRYVFSLGSNTESAYIDMLQVLNAKPDLPTAFFIDNDFIALGAMRALKERQIRVPEDVSIIGFDDIPASSIVIPGLTTMQVNREELGERAVSTLMQMIETPLTRTIVKQEIVPRLIERGSVRRL